jgi:hypothetical protein
MMRHKLDLRGNALDSLNEGLRKYVEGREGEVGSFKFAVLHFSHFMELLLKSAVAKEHRLLVYRKPWASDPKRSLTISMLEALTILRNAGHSMAESLVTDLEWLKGVRNNIEHYEFDLDVPRVRATLGRVIRAAVDFTGALNLTALEEDIAVDCREVFGQLLDEYKEQLAIARAEARRLGGGDTTYCALCGEAGIAYESDEGVTCLLCATKQTTSRSAWSAPRSTGNPNASSGTTTMLLTSITPVHTVKAASSGRIDRAPHHSARREILSRSRSTSLRLPSKTSSRYRSASPQRWSMLFTSPSVA